jgi:hypothetical protein
MGVGSEERVYLKRSRVGAAVGAEMDGQDGEARIGQGSRCRMPIRHAADPSAARAWAGFQEFEFRNHVEIRPLVSGAGSFVRPLRLQWPDMIFFGT